VVAGAVHRRREPQQAGADAADRELVGGVLGRDARDRLRPGGGAIGLGDRAGRGGERGARRDQERAIRAGERRAERRDRALVGLARRGVPGEVVDEAEVDHAVARRGAGAERRDVGELAAMDLGAGRGDGGGGGVGAREAEDAMTRAVELADDRGADEAGSTGDEDAHAPHRRSRRARCLGCSWRDQTVRANSPGVTPTMRRKWRVSWL
jgi:hypothetical protein